MHALAAQTTRMALVLSVTALMALPSYADKVRFTLATTNGAKDFSTQAMTRWQAAMKEQSGGDLDMTLLSGGSLGGDNQLLQQLATNEIQLNIAGPVVVHSMLKQYQCMEAEFVYKDEDHGYRVWTGKLGKEVSDKLEEQYGITIAGVGLRGAREVTANKPIREPSDLSGVKMRVTNPLRAEVFSAYGALPGPLPVSELYGALRQGVFDAEENPIPTIWGNKFYEVQKTINLTNHVISYYLVTANKGFVDSLSDENRKIFDSTLADAVKWLNETTRSETATLLDKMRDTGVEVIEPDVAAFRKIAQPIVAKFAAENCRPGLLEEIAEAAE